DHARCPCSAPRPPPPPPPLLPSTTLFRPPALRQPRPPERGRPAGAGLAGRHAERCGVDAVRARLRGPARAARPARPPPAPARTRLAPSGDDGGPALRRPPGLAHDDPRPRRLGPAARHRRHAV